MYHCNQTIGTAYFRTPRNTIKAFIDLLSVLEQHPNTDWRQLIGEIKLTEDKPSNMTEHIPQDESSQELAEFKI